jgi:heterodisulfide reductase subunit C2
LMDYFKQKVSAGTGRAAEKNIEIFHRQFLKNIKAYGRIFEGGLMQGYLLRTGQIWQPSKMIENTLLGLKMFRKGRLRLTPTRIKGIKKIREMFQRHGQ